MSDSILNSPPPMATVRLAYGDDEQQFADLRLPDSPYPWPTVILIHGGYWRAKYGLDYFGHAAAALTERGFATWNMEYRRVGNQGGGWPGTFLDIAAGADFLQKVAKLLPINLGRIVVLGHSAGGHLALWLAGRHRIAVTSPLYQPEPLRLRGVISIAGICNLQQAWELGLSNNAAAELLGGSPAEYPERYAAASPAELAPLGVEQVLLHGTADDDVPLALSTDYAALASARGDTATRLTLPHADHFAPVDPFSPEWLHVVEWVEKLK